MFTFERLAGWPGPRLSLATMVLRLLVVAADPNATGISTFFTNLSQDITVFALAMAGFFFGLAALLYMAAGVTGNERTRSQAIGSLYAALGGLALALLAGTITGLVDDATSGTSDLTNP
jgi:hypothetical protein